MKIAISLMCAGMALAGSSAFAQDAMKKDGAMGKDSSMQTMTMQQCKDHMAMSSKAGTMKDDAMMKKDAMCGDMMKKDGAMTKDSRSGEPMKK